MRDKDELKQSLSVSDIEKVLQYYNIDYAFNSQDDMVMETACHNKHGGSHKLYYYPEGQSFHCYTDCAESFDVYELVMKVTQTRRDPLNFNEAFRTVAHIMGVNIHASNKRVVQLGNSNAPIDDWDFINKLKRRRKNTPTFELVDEDVLNDFPRWYPEAWHSEGISVDTMEKFGIRFNPEHNSTIIPHRNPYGELIGIRTRNWRDTEFGKYLPLHHKGIGYGHPLGYNLYSLNENKETIKRKKKIMLVESEKSSLKAHSFFGDNNFCVSLCGSSMNNYQADLVLDLGVDEVIIAMDKDYINQPDLKYKEKVRKIAQHFMKRVSVYVITDTRNVMDYQECVMDRSRDEVINIMNFDKHLITDLEELE